MDQEKILPEGEDTVEATEEKAKTMWQMEKERWYDKLPLNLKQLDTIVIVCWILIFVVIGVIKKSAKEAGKPFIILKSGDIHKGLKLKSAMPQVCNAMRQSMNDGDIVLHTTPSGNSSTIEIQYNV